MVLVAEKDSGRCCQFATNYTQHAVFTCLSWWVSGKTYWSRGNLAERLQHLQWIMVRLQGPAPPPFFVLFKNGFNAVNESLGCIISSLFVCFHRSNQVRRPINSDGVPETGVIVVRVCASFPVCSRPTVLHASAAPPQSHISWPNGKWRVIPLYIPSPYTQLQHLRQNVTFTSLPAIQWNSLLFHIIHQEPLWNENALCTAGRSGLKMTLGQRLLLKVWPIIAWFCDVELNIF